MAKQKQTLKEKKKGKRSISDRQKTHAIISKLSYLGNRKAEKKIKKRLGEDWNIDRDLSTRRHKVFYNKKTNESVYSARGTKVSDFKDLKSDLEIVGSRFKKNLFRRSKRVKDEKKAFSKFSKKYSDYDRQGTGHSLGGAVIAELTKKDKDVEATAFSRGSFSTKGKYSRNLTDVVNPNDWISQRVLKQHGPQKKIIFGGKNAKHKFDKLSAHSINQFL